MDPPHAPPGDHPIAGTDQVMDVEGEVGERTDQLLPALLVG